MLRCLDSYHSEALVSHAHFVNLCSNESPREATAVDATYVNSKSQLAGDF